MSISVEFYPQKTASFCAVMCAGEPHTNHKGHRVSGEHIDHLHTGYGYEAKPITDQQLVTLFTHAREHDEATKFKHSIRIVLYEVNNAIPRETR